MRVGFGWLFSIVFVLSGCTAAPQRASTAAPAAAPPVATKAAAPQPALSGELTYAWWGASAFRNEVTQKVIDLFQQKNPNVKINPSIADFNTHFQKLTISAAAGDLPCLPQMQSTGLAAGRWMTRWSPRLSIRRMCRKAWSIPAAASMASCT